MICYKVKVETTNATNGTCCNRDNDVYYDCEDGFLYVVVENPAAIYSHFGKETVLSIERLGIGYNL